MEELEFEQNGKTFKDWLNVFSRRKKEIAIVFFSLLLLSVLTAIFIPAVYRSAAIILIQQQEIPQEMVRSTITSFADQRLQTIRSRVMTNARMWEIIEKHDLYEKLKKREPREIVIEKMRDDISFEIISADVIDPRSGRPTKASIAFKSSYDNRSSEKAYKVASELSNLYLNENIEERKQHAEEARSFLSTEAEKLENEISKLESDLAIFKENNVNRLPEMVQLNFQIMDRAERELAEVKRQIQSVKERQIYLSSELSQINPNAVLFSDSGERIMGSADRLKALQTELVRLSSIYSLNHPDIIRTKNEIKALEAEVGGVDNSSLYEELEIAKSELAKVEERYSSNHPDVKRAQRTVDSLEVTINEISNITVNKSVAQGDASNPAYIQLKSQLSAANSELTSLYTLRDSLNEKIQNLEQDIALSPSIEKEYRSLSRNYETANLRYQEIKVKLSQAELGESLEEGRKGERFEIIEPAIQSQKPVFPNRILILLLGLMLSIILSILFAIFRDNIDDSVRGSDDIFNLIGVRPLATIPPIITFSESKAIKMRKIQYSIALLSLFIVSFVLIHYFYKPLDVIWFVSMRKFGAL